MGNIFACPEFTNKRGNFRDHKDLAMELIDIVNRSPDCKVELAKTEYTRLYSTLHNGTDTTLVLTKEPSMERGLGARLERESGDEATGGDQHKAEDSPLIQQAPPPQKQREKRAIIAAN